MPDPAERARGTRVRAGNAMDRTRAGLVLGASHALAARGARRTTMADIAAAAGVAKATVYNHVRTRGGAYEMLADSEVDRLTDLLAGPDIAAALDRAATAIATHPVLRRLAADEPAALGAILLPSENTSARHERVLAALSALLGPELAPLAMRWLLSLALDPGGAGQRAAQAEQLAGMSRPAASEQPTDGDLPA